MVQIFTVHEAKTNLSKLLESADRGEEIIIARGKHPVVRLLLGVIPALRMRPLGLYQDEGFELGPEFFEPLPDDELEAWNQSYGSF